MYVYVSVFFFFFSSRRRHTRSLCDWSSDVCSSDLRDQELVAFLVVVVGPRIRQRFRSQGIAERKVVILDGEDIREIVRDLELEVELHRLHALVLHGERVLHALADEPLTSNREGVVVEPAGQGVSHEERGGEVLDLVGGEQQRTLAVDRQPKAREEPSGLGEETLTFCVEVAELVADAEGGALEYSQLARHQLSARSIRPPEDCARALTTSSSTLTCGGRVTANRMHSAMSSGFIASTPW